MSESERVGKIESVIGSIEQKDVLRIMNKSKSVT